MVFIMLTNILEEHQKLSVMEMESGRLVEDAFNVKEENGGYILPGVVSRKKQLIPEFITALQQNS